MHFIVVQTPKNVKLSCSQTKQTFTQTRCSPGGYSGSSDLLILNITYMYMYMYM